MGALKQKWTAEEEEALIAGIKKHGTGKWKNILRDPQFSHVLAARSNIDLKDKWRNMSVTAYGEGSRRGKAAVIKPKVPKTQVVFQYSPSASQATDEDANDNVLDSIKNTPDGKQPPPRYDAMILEAVSNITDPNGADTGSINDFIEQRHEVPSNFRRLLSSNLRRLVAQDKLEKVQLLSHETKVQTYYKMKKDATGTKAPIPKPLQDSRFAGFTLLMAQNIAEAENKSFLANEAVKEAERVERMAEQSACMKQFFEDILEQCKRGEPVIMAF